MRDDWSRQQRHLLRLWRGSAAALVAACLLTGYLIGSPASTPHPRPAPPAAAPLRGTYWRLTAYLNAQGVLARVDGDAELTATFNRDGTVAGKSGCNYYNADYAIRGTALTIGSPGSSDMACMWARGARRTVDLMGLERTFLDDLPRAGSYRIVGRRLALLAAPGTPLLVFTAGSYGTAPLIGRAAGTPSP